MIGTSGFIAPEVACGYHYTDKADIYSLGRLCIQLAHGKHITGIEVSDLKMKNQYSQDFIDFVERCLAKNPDQRASLEDLKKVIVNLQCINK